MDALWTHAKGLFKEMISLLFRNHLAEHGNAHDAALIAGVTEALSSDDFWNKHSLVHDFSAELEHLRTWGNGCSCHEALLKQGKPVSMCDNSLNSNGTNKNI